MDQATQDFFRFATECRSLLNIQYHAEDLMSELDGACHKSISEISICNDLDKIRMMAHEALGETQKANELSQWLESKAEKRKQA